MANSKLNRKSKTALKWVEADQRYAAGGSLPRTRDPDENIFLHHLHRWDARKAEAYLLTRADANELLRFRTLLFRGRLGEAEAALSRIGGAPDSSMRAEWYLETARLHAYRGDWVEAEACASAGLSEQPKPISLLTLHQVRALARFEQGNWADATSDLERVESLHSVFPNSHSAFYSQTIRIKLVARTRGLDEAQRLLGELWTTQSHSEVFSIDRAHALLRIELDLRRLRRLPHADLAAASVAFAEAIGEKTYIGLGWVDCLCADSRWASLEVRLSHDSDDLIKAKRLLAEVRSSETQVSVSALSMRDYLQGPRVEGSRSTLPALDALAGQKFVWIERDLMFDLPARTHRFFKLTEGQSKALRVFVGKEASVPKAVFFRAVWGGQKYAPRLHDGAIWTLVHRLKKATSLPFTVSEGQVGLPDVYVIG